VTFPRKIFLPIEKLLYPGMLDRLNVLDAVVLLLPTNLILKLVKLALTLPVP
jgi:hypothetical protein